MKKNENYIKLKQSIPGDVFAYKIEEDEEFKGRYLLLIRYVNPSYEEQHFTHGGKDTLLNFRIKITEKSEIPKTKEKIEILPYIQVSRVHYEARHFPLSGEMTYAELVESHKGVEFYPDEKGYLQVYIYKMLYDKKTTFNQFQYIGNFDLTPPDKEFIPFGYTSGPISSFPENIEERILEKYRLYNLNRKFVSKAKIENDSPGIPELLLIRATLALQKAIDEDHFNFKPENIHLNYWDPTLYGSDVACDVRGDYRDYYEESKKNGTSNQEMVKELMEDYEEYIADEYDGPIFWIVLANEQMRKKNLTKYQKEKALEAIEIDLEHWKKEVLFNERKTNLRRLKKKLEDYECKE